MEKGYLAMRLIKEMDTDGWVRVSLEGEGRIGMVPVFKTKKAAREVYGKKVELWAIGTEEIRSE